jgi:transposase InsO family protein
LRKEFDSLSFKDGETVDEFSMRIDALVQQLRTLEDEIEEPTVVCMFLQALPRHYHQIAMAIETLLELGEISIEELIGRLKAAEERYVLTGGGVGVAQLNLTQDELVTRLSKRLHINADKAPGSGGPSWSQQHGRGGSRDKAGRGERHKGIDNGSREKKGDGTARGEGGARGDGGARGGGRDAARDECRYCGARGHWARECPKRRRDAAHLAQVEAEQEAHTLLVATVVEEVNASTFSPSRPTAAPTTHLDESRLFIQLGEEGDSATTRWILDSCASNHMPGARSAFAELDDGVRGTVRFGDGSSVAIEGRDTMLFKCKTGEHQKLTRVYHIPRLTANIISLGQLEEDRYKIQLGDGMLKIWYPRRRLVAAVRRGASRPYVLNADVDKPVCLAARAEEDAWRWHAWYGHLSFQGLQRLSKGEMVRGMPRIDHVDQVCDGCLVGKQRRLPFPAVSKYRATRQLELVHADLCGPVTPPTAGGKKMFLLVVDEMSRFMWLVLLSTKDEDAAAIVRLQTRAEAEVGRKLDTLRTDHGGEFTAKDFGEYCAGQGIQRHLTAPYTPQQNGVVEKWNQTVLGMARCMLKSKGVPGRFWGETVTMTVFVLNRAPTRALADKTPYEAWYGHKPAVHFLRTFGCVAHVKVAGGHLR